MPVNGAHARDWIHAVVGECCSHDRQIAAVAENGALLEVEVEDLVDVVADHAEVQHEVGDRAVAVTRGAFGHEDGHINLHLAAKVLTKQVEQSI